MALKIETKRVQIEAEAVEKKNGAPKVEVLGKMGEMSLGKNGGADRKPTARQS